MLKKSSGSAHQVLLFYAYKTINDPSALMKLQRAWCAQLDLAGRIIIAKEGINATVEGTIDATEQFVRLLHAETQFKSVPIKRSASAGNSFHGLSIKVRNEIVGTGFSRTEADPERKTATKITPEELHAWFRSRDDFTVIDMRNNYEFASGHFKGSIQPDISASRHLPLAMGKLEPLKQKTVVTVCTGGIRCEKMSAYLESNGFENVYQLDGGIHTYMERYPGEDFLGTLYTFDNRVTMHFGGAREVIGMCRLCGASTEAYINCSNQTCHLHFLACDSCAPGGSASCSDACKPLIY